MISFLRRVLPAPLKKALTVIVIVVAITAAYRAYDWGGILLLFTALVTWGLLHLNRILTVFKRAAEHPIGHVDSAVMLNARLREGMKLMQVMALTRALGVPEAASNNTEEVYSWMDVSGSKVQCAFVQGRLARWRLERPTQTAVDDVIDV